MKRLDFIKSLGALAVIPFLPKKNDKAKEFRVKDLIKVNKTGTCPKCGKEYLCESPVIHETSFQGKGAYMASCLWYCNSDECQYAVGVGGYFDRNMKKIGDLTCLHTGCDADGAIGR